MRLGWDRSVGLVGTCRDGEQGAWAGQYQGCERGFVLPGLQCDAPQLGEPGQGTDSLNVSPVTSGNHRSPGWVSPK